MPTTTQKMFWTGSNNSMTGGKSMHKWVEDEPPMFQNAPSPLLCDPRLHLKQLLPIGRGDVNFIVKKYCSRVGEYLNITVQMPGGSPGQPPGMAAGKCIQDLLTAGHSIQLFQKTLSEEKHKVFKPSLQGNVGCFKFIVTPLNWSLIFIRHLY